MKGLGALILLAPLAGIANGQDCPGYRASNVEETGSGLTADLTLAGDPCDIYGQDIQELRLIVEYQTSRSFQSLPPT